ncbi:hypothetical protein [Dyella silvae]|uniref:hypothetical protein n=1 Tax=Dyella silvae TaxID=2994424 RepID=UPI002263C807|nr:hypothetical protein [Dyella silvae]
MSVEVVQQLLAIPPSQLRYMDERQLPASYLPLARSPLVGWVNDRLREREKERELWVESAAAIAALLGLGYWARRRLAELKASGAELFSGASTAPIIASGVWVLLGLRVLNSLAWFAVPFAFIYFVWRHTH